jgi:hypothetical protein
MDISEKFHSQINIVSALKNGYSDQHKYLAMFSLNLFVIMVFEIIFFTFSDAR